LYDFYFMLYRWYFLRIRKMHVTLYTLIWIVNCTKRETWLFKLYFVLYLTQRGTQVVHPSLNSPDLFWFLVYLWNKIQLIRVLLLLSNCFLRLFFNSLKVDWKFINMCNHSYLGKRLVVWVHNLKSVMITCVCRFSPLEYYTNV